jgi:hypothetical protein
MCSLSANESDNTSTSLLASAENPLNEEEEDDELNKLTIKVSFRNGIRKLDMNQVSFS